MKMSSVKVFRIKAVINRGGRESFEITREFRATKQDDAIESFYSLLGSWHGVKRRMITIKNVEEISSLEEIRNPLIKEMMEADKNDLIIPYRK